MTEIEQPPQNGIDLSAPEDENNGKARPADIEQDMREMERRKRVEAIMSSKLFREELERIVDCARDSGHAAGILQQLSDIVGVPSSRVSSVFKTSTCMLPINDIRGVESMGYAKGEKILRCKLAATFRLLDLYGWTQGLGAQITARLKVDQEYFLVNPYGLLFHEITASSLNKVDMQGNIVEQGTTNFGVNKSHFVLHSVIHAARPDIRCAIYVGCSPVVAISSLKTGLLPLTKDSCVLGDLSIHSYTGYLNNEEDRNKLVRSLGPNSKVMLLTNHGALCCGETIEEAFFAACHIVQACEIQLKLLPIGLDNLVLIPEEARKLIYDQSRRPPEDLEKKFAAAIIDDSNKSEEDKKEGVDNTPRVIAQAPKWRVGGAEFEALMRMLDNAGYRTGYIYRYPLIKSEPPKPKNDVELPPAVSSLGYLLEEEEFFRQGIWKKGDLRKGGDRSRWLNSPNVYQKVEVLETGTPDPKKITKWVAEGSPTHSTPVRIDDPLQFVPVNTNPKEFKRLQQQIKDNRRADKISAGPQSHILEGVTWDEANRIKDATVSSAGDHVVLMGAASKGIIQRGFQHNATVYKAPYAKNPFDNVTDDELNEYKRTVEGKKKSIHGEYTDTDFSESEALSSLQTSGAQQQTKQTTTTTTAAVSQSEPEDTSEHQVMRIQTEQAPIPSQPEVVLSEDIQFLIKTYQSTQAPKILKSIDLKLNSTSINQYQTTIECGQAGREKQEQLYFTEFQENNYKSHDQNDHNAKLIKNIKQNVFSTYPHTYTQEHFCKKQGNGNISNFSIYDNDSTYQYLSKDLSKFYDTSYTSRYTLRSDRDHYACCGENVCSKDMYLELLKKNFSICCTPKICDKIFEPVPKSRSLQIQSAAKSDQIVHRCEGKSASNSQAHSISPYRTVSHFGFNKPMREPQPNHKHLAVKTVREQKYVPLRRSVSYEEIFSTPRYLNLCECCFELIVRLKPELMKCKTKFKKSIEYSDSHLKLTSEKNYLTVDKNRNLSEKDNIVLEPYSTFPLQLNKVEDETDSKKDLHEAAITNSTFNEKITRMNYSELSLNTECTINTPHAVKSTVDLCELEESILKPPIELITNKFKDEDLYFTDNRNATNSQSSLTGEINNFLDAIPNNPEETKNISIEFIENVEKIQNVEENSKKMMSRDERARRKLEFQELWEDHVNFAENRDRVSDFGSYSNIEAEKHAKENTVIDAEKEVFKEQNSAFPLTNYEVEEFKSTLSRITFHSSERKCSDHLTDKESNHNESSENTDNFSPLERTILAKIHSNNLIKTEEIFGKIDNTIRNKITPSKLELIIRKQAILLQDVHKCNDNENVLSKSFNSFNTNFKKESLRRSSSLTSFRLNSSTPMLKTNKSSSFVIESQKKIAEGEIRVNHKSPSSSPYLKKSVVKKDKKYRNFILENIRNVKRLQCNVDAKTKNKHTFTSSRILECKQNSHDTLASNPIIRSPRNSASSAVYSFQAKVVRGSPRFWISLSQSSKKKLQPAIIGTVTTPTEKHDTKPIHNSLAMSTVKTQVVNNVDEEINALGDEIQQIQPRLEKYKRKLDDFGHRVADCVNNINECVTTQENIISVQNQLRDFMKLREYTDEIMCRVQTYSLSETED